MQAPYHELMKTSFNYFINESFKCSEERIMAQASAFCPSNKQMYFVEHMMTALMDLFEKAKLTFEKSVVGAAVSGVAQGALRAALLKACLPDAIGEAVQGGNAAATVLHTAYKVNEMQVAQRLAAKILNFFGVLSQDGNTIKFDDSFASHLVFALWFEFRIHIEMMEKNDNGCGVFTRFLISRMRGCIEASERGDFNETTRLEQLKFIRIAMYSNARELPKTRVAVDENIVKWQIDELLLDSPIVLVESLTTANNTHPICEISLYRQVDRKKTRGVSSVSAEGSHKYPPRFLMSTKDAALMPGYEKVPDFKIGKGLLLSTDQRVGYLENDQDKIDKLSRNYIEMFGYAREYKRSSDSTDINLAMVCFVRGVKILLENCNNLSVQGWIMTASELIGLYNFYQTQLKPFMEAREVRDLHPQSQQAYRLIGDMSQHCLCVFQVTEQIVDQQKRRVLIDKQFLEAVERSLTQQLKLEVEQREFKSKLDAVTPSKSPARLFVEAPEQSRRFLLKSDDIEKLTRIITYQGSDNQNYTNCALEKEACDRYNASVMRYFSCADENFKEKYEAIAEAMIPFAISLNDIAAFNHCDMPLLRRIAEICNFLKTSFEISFKELPKETTHNGSELLRNGLVFKCLMETETIFRNCKNVSEDKDSFHEKFNVLSKTNKILICFGTATVFGLMAYAGFRFFSTPVQKSIDTNKPLNEVANEKPASETRTLKGWSAASVTAIGATTGIFVFGIYYVWAEVYSQGCIKRRVYAELAREIESNLPNRRLTRLFPVAASLQAEVEKYVSFSQKLEEDRKRIFRGDTVSSPKEESTASTFSK